MEHKYKNVRNLLIFKFLSVYMGTKHKLENVFPELTTCIFYVRFKKFRKLYFNSASVVYRVKFEDKVPLNPAEAKIGA